MKTYIQQPKSSDTVQPKASKQAPAKDILQAYRDKIVQRQDIDEDELLQDKFNDTAQLEEFEEDELLQGKFDTAQREEIDEDELLQGKFDPSSTIQKEEAIQPSSENNTGMPDNLKNGIEALSGYSMDDVRVHYNSDKPAQLQALAYAQGTDIHIAPGQEQHLSHEAWHVVQQKQGRVQATMQLQGVNVNDNEGLEKEADAMGGKAMQMATDPFFALKKECPFNNVSQMLFDKELTEALSESENGDSLQKMNFAIKKISSLIKKLPINHSTNDALKDRLVLDGFRIICKEDFKDLGEETIDKIYSLIEDIPVNLICAEDEDSSSIADLTETIAGYHFSKEQGYKNIKRSQGADFEATLDDDSQQKFDPFTTPLVFGKNKDDNDIIWKTWVNDTFEKHTSGRKGAEMNTEGFGFLFGEEEDNEETSQSNSSSAEGVISRDVGKETKGVLDLTYTSLKDIQMLISFFSKIILKQSLSEEEADYLRRTHIIFLDVFPLENRIEKALELKKMLDDFRNK